MEMLKMMAARQPDEFMTCPNCGGCDYEDNSLSEGLYVEAAKEAPRLRHEGRTDEAIDVLSALCTIRIVNFLRPQFLCLSCGVAFDG